MRKLHSAWCCVLVLLVLGFCELSRASIASNRTANIDDENAFNLTVRTTSGDYSSLLKTTSSSRKLGFFPKFLCIFGNCDDEEGEEDSGEGEVTNGGEDENDESNEEEGEDSTNDGEDGSDQSDGETDNEYSPCAGNWYPGCYLDSIFDSIYGNDETDGNVTGDYETDDDAAGFDDDWSPGNVTLDDIFDFSKLFPEGSLLNEIFDPNDEKSVFEAIADIFANATSQFTSGIVDAWMADVNFTDTVCNNTNTTTAADSNTASSSSPECYASNGKEGFWVCRTLYNPFTGAPASKNMCISQGGFIPNSDVCGCCDEECPKPCPCTCKIMDENDGVLIQYKAYDVINIGQEYVVEACVPPLWAVSMTSSLESQGIACVTNCTTSTSDESV